MSIELTYCLKENGIRYVWTGGEVEAVPGQENTERDVTCGGRNIRQDAERYRRVFKRAFKLMDEVRIDIAKNAKRKIDPDTINLKQKTRDDLIRAAFHQEIGRPAPLSLGERF